MKVVTQSITVRAPIAKVFDAYVNRIDEWWPRYIEDWRFTFAPREVEPDHIRFEAEEGGRFYETFANGDEYVIGHVTEYSPPERIAYTWKDPSWNDETLIEISFEQEGDETTLNLRHSGFEALDLDGMAEGYSAGSQTIYTHLQAWLREQLEAA